jgi:SAM-dependent methyltransferase
MSSDDPSGEPGKKSLVSLIETGLDSVVPGSGKILKPWLEMWLQSPANRILAKDASDYELAEKIKLALMPQLLALMPQLKEAVRTNSADDANDVSAKLEPLITDVLQQLSKKIDEGYVAAVESLTSRRRPGRTRQPLQVRIPRPIEPVVLESNDMPQDYLRALSMQQFGLLWLLLDQLPSGGWGRSTMRWMAESTVDVPVPYPDNWHTEGGIESACLACLLLSRVLPLNGRWWTDFKRYVDERRTAIGTYGTKSPARDGGWKTVDHPRHTAMILLVLSRRPDAPLFSADINLSLRSLFSSQAQAKLKADRNPAMLYAVVSSLLGEVTEPARFKSLEESTRRVIQKWRREFLPELAERACASFLEQAPGLEPMAPAGAAPDPTRPDHFGALVYPYGGFARMQTYTHLSTALLTPPFADRRFMDRLALGISALVDAYLRYAEATGEEENPLSDLALSDLRYPDTRGVRPFPAAAHPDLSCTALLLAVLTRPPLMDALFAGRDAERFARVSRMLTWDLINLFDRYLVNPNLYRYGCAQAFAAVVQVPIAVRSSGGEQVTPVGIDAEGISLAVEKARAEGLCEKSIGQLVDNLLFSPGGNTSPAANVFSLSLRRLLLDLCRPGVWPEGRFDFSSPESDQDSLVEQTVSAYAEPTFAERFTQVWGDRIETEYADTFLGALRDCPAPSILDAGCGSGQYARYFMDQHTTAHVVIADASEAFLAKAAARVWPDARPDVDACIRMRLDQIGHWWQDAFDGIWCLGPMVHFPPKTAHAVLRGMHAALRHDGVLFVSFQVSNTRLQTDDNRYFHHYADESEVADLVGSAGFSIAKQYNCTLEQNTYGEPLLTMRWHSILARRAEVGPHNERTVEALRNQPPRVRYETLRLPTHLSISEQALTRAAYDRSAGAFQVLVEELLKQNKDGTLPRPVSWLCSTLREVFPDQHAPLVLDLGCGPGAHTVAMHGEGIDAYGVDISDRMIKIAMQAHPKLQERFIVGDMAELDRNSHIQRLGPVHALYSIASFHHIPKKRALGLLARGGAWQKLLRPRGVLLLSLQIDRKVGYDPDGRYTEHWTQQEIVSILQGGGWTVTLADDPIFALDPGKNTFRRMMEYRFLGLVAQRP